MTDAPTTNDAAGRPAADFIPVDAEGGLVFTTTLPGLGSDFLSDRSPEIAESAWASLARGAVTGSGGARWVHLDRTRARAQAWVREGSGLPALVADALLAEETRPRAVERSVEGLAGGETGGGIGGLLVILRGVNLHPGAEPDELIVIRMWIEPGRVITLRQFRFATIRTLREQAASGCAPATTGAMLVAIANGLSLRLGPVVDNLQNLLDDAEDRLAGEDAKGLDTRPIADVRRQAIRLRRYLAPQRDALLSLAASPSPLLNQELRAELQEIAQRTARFVEDLEEVRDRAAVSQEELRAARERQANKTMYLLTLVAAVALPLGLITGLLGINVGGMPGADEPTAFWVVTVGMVVIAGGLVGVFKWLKWL